MLSLPQKVAGHEPYVVRLAARYTQSRKSTFGHTQRKLPADPRDQVLDDAFAVAAVGFAWLLCDVCKSEVSHPGTNYEVFRRRAADAELTDVDDSIVRLQQGDGCDLNALRVERCGGVRRSKAMASSHPRPAA